jgi:hypothetical protein
MKSLTAGELLAKVREVVERERVTYGSVVLEEDGRGNKCAPIAVSCRGAFWALRVKHNDHLRLLAGSKADDELSFCKLPDPPTLRSCAPRARRAPTRTMGAGSSMRRATC